MTPGLHQPNQADGLRPGAGGEAICFPAGPRPGQWPGENTWNRASSRCRQARRHREEARFHGLVCTALLGDRSPHLITWKQQDVEHRVSGEFIVRAGQRPYITVSERHRSLLSVGGPASRGQLDVSVD